MSSNPVVTGARKADGSDPRHVAVPFAGVVQAMVSEGDAVASGQMLATIEAMKMEAFITAPSPGVVERLVIDGPRPCEGGDLLLVLR